MISGIVCYVVCLVITHLKYMGIATWYKELSYRRGTARRAMLVEILSRE